MIDLVTPINTLKESLEKVQLNEQNTATYEKLKILIPILESRINGMGSIICNPTYLNNIFSYLSNIQSYVNSDIASPSSGYYGNIPGQIDNIVAQLLYIPAVDKTTAKQSLGQIISTYKKQNENIIEKIKQEKDGLEKEVAALRQEINVLETQVNSKKIELSTLAEDFNKQFKSAQNSRDEVSQTRLCNTLQLWDDAGKKYSERVKQSEENIQKSFDEKYEDLEKQDPDIVVYETVERAVDLLGTFSFH